MNINAEMIMIKKKFPINSNFYHNGKKYKIEFILFSPNGKRIEIYPKGYNTNMYKDELILKVEECNTLNEHRIEKIKRIL